MQHGKDMKQQEETIELEIIIQVSHMRPIHIVNLPSLSLLSIDFGSSLSSNVTQIYPAPSCTPGSPAMHWESLITNEASSPRWRM